MKVGIIGAGAAGLAAAYELGKQGHRVVVYERAPFMGGQASTFDVGGARLERGYHHLFTSDTDIIDLNEEIGLGDRMTWIDSSVGTLYDGRIYNFVTPMDLLRFKPLSLVDRVRLGVATLALQRIRDWRKLESVTAVDWLRKWAGKSGFEGFWGPMLRGKFGENYYREIGMPWIWGKIATRFASREKGLSRESLGYPIGSFGEFFDVLAEKIEAHGSEIHLSTPVTHIVSGEGRPALEYGRPDGSAGREEFDAVISTTHSYMFMRLAPRAVRRLQGAAREHEIPRGGPAGARARQAPVPHLLAQRRRPVHAIRGRHRAHEPDTARALRRAAPRLPVQLPGAVGPPLRPQPRGAAGRVRPTPSQGQPLLRSVVGRQELPPEGQRRPAGHRHTLL